MDDTGRKIKKSFVKQRDRSDCGVACLLSIIRYHGGEGCMENLRQASGTTTEGTTMLGLYTAAGEWGLEAEGLKGDPEALKSIEGTSILHVCTADRLLHYVVCYGYDGYHFIIGDPAAGVSKCPPDKLTRIWHSKCLLLLKPGVSFKKASRTATRKSWLSLLQKKDHSILGVIGLTGLAASVLGMGLTVFSQLLIDRILPEGDKKKLITGIAFVFLLLIVRALISCIRSHLANIQNRDFNNRLMAGFFDKLIHLPRSFFNSRRTGELVARMEDSQRIQAVIAHIFSDLVNEGFVVLASLCLMFWYSIPVGFVSLTSLPLYWLLACATDRRIETCQHEVMAAHARKTANYVSTIRGIDEIKVNNRECHFSLLNRLIYGVFQDKIFMLGKLGISIQLMTDLISLLTTTVTLTVSAFMVLHRQLSLGELAAIISVSAGLYPAAGNIAFSNIRLRGAGAAFDRMSEFAEIAPEYDNRHSEVNDIVPLFSDLKARNLSFSYPGRKTIIRDLSLDIRKGEISVLTGESGCGKTTFLNLLQQFYRPCKGSLLVNAIPLEEISPIHWRSMIGVVPQEISFFNGNILCNISLSNVTGEWERAQAFCGENGFDPFFTLFPAGYETLLGEEGISLSGGQKQLLAFARALYKQPQLLLLDEPTSSMDGKTEKFVIETLRKIRHRMGILIISHRSSMTSLADALYILEKGITKLAGMPAVQENP